ncbi:hypothetical protein RIR_jg22476.t1 [Rhizophagus irregularis DAOM 181602=DAOM 197198]|nr:hypothetical protein RIR_jg22476.t1 [Rhizophagus irregularis DAOM 181602=DAOM 197198]
MFKKATSSVTATSTSTMMGIPGLFLLKVTSLLINNNSIFWSVIMVKLMNCIKEFRHISIHKHCHHIGRSYVRVDLLIYNTKENALQIVIGGISTGGIIVKASGFWK